MTPSRREFLATSLALTGALVDLDSAPPQDLDALFARSLVVDALSADENWNDPEPIFAAYKASGVTAIHTSLANANFTVASRDLAAWQARFDRWPDRLIKIVKGAQFAEAKKTGRIGVLLGFQNGTIVDS